METGIYLGLTEDRLLLYMDILGFSKIVDKNRKITMDTRDVLISNLPAFCDSILDKYLNGQGIDSDIRFLWGSDTIAVSTSIDNSRQLFEIYDDIANKFFCHGLVLRGNISIGELYHENNIWGPAFIKAVELEKTDKYPRIIISHETFDRIRAASQNDFFNYLVESEIDGYMYFDYIEYVINKSIKLGTSFLVAALKVYLKTIQVYYSDAIEDKHREKWIWYAKEMSNAIKNNANAIDEDFAASIEKGRKSFLDDIIGHEKFLRDLEPILRGERIC